MPSQAPPAATLPTSLRHQLLIAMPQLDDPHFHHSVTYLFEHNADGAMGVIINRPIDATMAELAEWTEWADKVLVF